jgi:transketolase
MRSGLPMGLRMVLPLPRRRGKSNQPEAVGAARGALVIIGSPIFPVDPKGIAGRDASGRVLNVLAQNVPWLLGGSADLGPSNKTTLTFEGAGAFEPGTPGGRNLHFGVREHAMAAVVNGLSLSKLRAFA